MPVLPRGDIQPNNCKCILGTRCHDADKGEFSPEPDKGTTRCINVNYAIKETERCHGKTLSWARDTVQLGEYLPGLLQALGLIVSST